MQAMSKLVVLYKGAMASSVTVISCHIHTYVQGYKQNRSFIVAQSPMENTVRDFWRMIFNQRCATIVMLCELVENNQVISYITDG